MNKELQRMFRYAVVGVGNVAIDFLLLNLFLALNFNLYLAVSLSFIVAATNSYYFNRKWTFKDSKKSPVGRQYLIFVLANGVGLLLNNALVYLFLKYIFFMNVVVTTNLAKLAAIFFVVIWNYSINRFLVFPMAKAEAIAPSE